MSKAVLIGCCIQFRKLLYEAVGQTMRTAYPMLYDSVHTAFNQYERNISLDPDYLVCCFNL